MKQKNIKKINSKSKKKNIVFSIFLGVILMTIIVVLFSFSALLFLLENENIPYNVKSDTQKIKIATDKKNYSIGENIELSVKNRSTNSIYFEPCEYLDKFEKMVDEKWEKSSEDRDEKVYDESGFKKEDNITNCEIELPKEGAGLYRAVVQIYYECESPGRNMCANSKAFYSNEFEVKADDDFCEDKVLENCDGKKVSVTGVAVNSKTYFLSNLVERDVKYTWFEGIMIRDSKSPFSHVRLEDGKVYNIIGVISAGGGICGGQDRTEQCAGGSYPTVIEVEKIHPIFLKAH